jgi:hypothetical protein
VPVALKIAASEGGVMSTSPSIYMRPVREAFRVALPSPPGMQEVLVQSPSTKMRNNAVYSFEDKGDV